MSFLSPAAAADPPTEREALIASLEELDGAINTKIERDLDTIAFAYWSAFEIRRARRLADWTMAPVELIKTALDINLFEKGVGGIRSRLENAQSALELAALTTGVIQANEAVGRLWPAGPELGNALDAMITSASAHPKNAQAFQAAIRRHLEGEGTTASSIVLAAPGASAATETQAQIRGVGEVRRALAAELARLKTDLAASPPDPAIAERAARSVRELTQTVRRSAGMRQEVSLPGTRGRAGTPCAQPWSDHRVEQHLDPSARGL